MPELDIDLLVLIMVSESQSKKLMAKLNKQLFFFTIIDSTNSLFHEPTVCLLMGLNHTRMESLSGLVETYCQPYRSYIPVQTRTTAEFSQLAVMESQEGGATLFTLPVEYFERF